MPDERLIRVVFEWSDRFGRCYDCGVPAAYESSEHRARPENLRCAVCAARDAAGGATITYLFEEEDPPLWERDEIQFPRLISEILATIEITNEDWAQLRDSMDLLDKELQELFDRAQTAWERAKEVHT